MPTDPSELTDQELHDEYVGARGTYGERDFTETKAEGIAREERLHALWVEIRKRRLVRPLAPDLESIERHSSSPGQPPFEGGAPWSIRDGEWAPR
jgi:hypothetical protein